MSIKEIFFFLSLYGDILDASFFSSLWHIFSRGYFLSEIPFSVFDRNGR